ncbi:RNA polymerase primary sigma factor [Eubacterium pyruvativorans]|uniref:RNA polymerase primary sigma factor n=1 Tax=Eubacterium pyruvativorans TaxID=155865 RepID=A0A1I7I1Q6_9FIRM|nr:sigma-70 family RNA polymerase sigma factor [Eubacterium pyruvativorans]SFO36286.1 RNA polymerase primary sigma factor [Eubacterium pyruvativorans]SFU66835.1 RNA polymerase primary sigma factor [Eubacterium pyruvativorans]
MGSDNRTSAYQHLVRLSEKQGYVLFDDIIDASDKWSLPIQDVDWLSSSITARGILVYDTAPATKSVDSDDVYDDYAQVDYEETFDRVIKKDHTLQPFIKYVRKIKPPQAREMDQLKYQVKEGNQYARKRVFEMHLRFAVRIALQTAEQFRCEMADTLQEACIGLLYAVDKYDPDSGDPFGSYASLWILQNVRRTLPTRRPVVYYPVHVKEGYISVCPILKRRGYIGRWDWNTTDLEDIRQIIKQKLDCDDSHADDVINQFIPLESFDEQYEMLLKNIDDYEKHELHWSVHLERCFYSNDTLVEISDEALKKDVNDALRDLKERERSVIRARYGLDDGEAKTLEAIGEKLGITRERVRQIEAKALEKLRKPSRSKKLATYYLE